MAGKATRSAGGPEAGAPSVSSQILARFVELVAADAELPGIGERLKKALLQDGDFSEIALRQALFGDATL